MVSTRRWQAGSTRRVLHRVRVLFFLFLLLPTLLVAGLSYFQVRGTLVDEAYGRLYDDNRFHAARLLERLLSINKDLLALQNQLSPEATADDLPTAVAIREKAHALFVDGNKGGTGNPVFVATNHRSVVPSELNRHSNTMGRAIITVREERGEIWMTVPPASGRKRSDVALHALLKNSYLFGDEHDQLINANLCIIREESALYCTSGAQTYVSQLLELYQTDRASRLSSWASSDAGRVLVVFRELFLPSQFESSIWTVATLEDEKTVFASIQVFHWLFPALLALLILGSLLIISIQTRRRFKPLEVLTLGAQKLGGGDFGARITVSSGDEFEDLANSFNSMAQRLGNQFEFLTMMSKIDRILLTHPNRLRVAETIVREVPAKMGLDYFVVLVLDSGNSDSGNLFVHDPAEAGGMAIHAAHIDASLVTELADDSQHFLRVQDSCARGLDACLRPGVDTLRVYPLAESRQIYGALCLSEQEIAALGSDIAERMIDIVGRLTVALSAVERQYQLYEQAYFDELTGLPNRTLFVDRLEQSLRHAARNATRVGIIYADLDRFKNINDTHGHFSGDDVLRETAQRLRALLRESDVVARISGDEFVFALPGLREPSAVMKVVEETIAALETPFNVKGQDFILDVSIGISMYPEDGESAEELLKNADLAMYRAKASPGSRHRFFEEAMNRAVNERSRLGQDLLHAVSRGQLSLVYQPKVDADTDRIHSVEALVRWRHPVHGWISPAKFIPIAEETGAIQYVGEFALAQACSQFAAWREKGLPIGQVAVNISPHQVLYSDLETLVASTLSENRLEPGYLELEITESLLMDDYAKSEKVLSKLKALGVSLALDDFGTGYSSLAHIHQLSFDTLKIDKCFLDDLGVRPNAEAIIDSILALGHSLGKTIVAEGVNDPEQLHCLKGKACDLYQGYYFSKPLTADEVEELLVIGEALPWAANDKLKSDQGAAGVAGGQSSGAAGMPYGSSSLTGDTGAH